jgi:hypothetical protein
LAEKLDWKGLNLILMTISKYATKMIMPEKITAKKGKNERLIHKRETVLRKNRRVSIIRKLRHKANTCI